jgi:hypothetical protein
MADLSHLLGDVYGDDPDGEPVRREPAAEQRSAAPDWADDSVLDAAFANWTPGPPPDAPAAEREVLGTATGTTPAAPLPDDLAAALSAALVGAPPPDPTAAPPPESPAPAVGAVNESSPLWNDLSYTATAPGEAIDPFADAGPLVPVLPWQRSDDDILPRRTPSSLGFRR